MATKAYIFAKGHRFEKIASQAYALRIGFDIPAKVVQHRELPWARVSLDCFNFSQQFVGEIKLMGMADWSLLKEKGVVPDHYMPQIQYQLLCTGFKEIHFIGVNDNKQIAATIVQPDIEMIKKIVRYCAYFWSLVQKKQPPKQVQQDYKYLTRIAAKKACNRIYAIDAKIKSLFEERDGLQKTVLDVAKSTRMVFQGKAMINLSHFDSDDLKLVSELEAADLNHLGRSIKDTLQLIIIKNNQKHIKGAPNGRKKSSKKGSKKKSVKTSSKSTRSKSKSNPSKRKLKDS